MKYNEVKYYIDAFQQGIGSFPNGQAWISSDTKYGQST